MLKLAEETTGSPNWLYVMVNKLIFRRVKHPEAALRYLNQALQLGDWKAVKRLIRLLVQFLHKRLVNNRRIILDVLDRVCQNGQSPALRRNFALFLLIERESPGQGNTIESRQRHERAFNELLRAADGGDAIANLVAGTFALKEELGGRIHSFFAPSYTYFSRSISLGCASAMTAIGGSIDGGLIAVGRELLLRAARLGDCDAFQRLLVSRGSVASDAWAIAVSAFIPHARRLTFDLHDPAAAKLLATAETAAPWAATHDSVFVSRLFRVASIGRVDLAGIRIPPFLGERPHGKCAVGAEILWLAALVLPELFASTIVLPSSLS